MCLAVTNNCKCPNAASCGLQGRAQSRRDGLVQKDRVLPRRTTQLHIQNAILVRLQSCNNTVNFLLKLPKSSVSIIRSIMAPKSENSDNVAKSENSDDVGNAEIGELA